MHVYCVRLESIADHFVEGQSICDHPPGSLAKPLCAGLCLPRFFAKYFYGSMMGR